MSGVAIFLVTIGIADICSRSFSAAWPPFVVAPVAPLACAALCDLWCPGDLLLLALTCAGAVAWEALGSRTEHAGTHHLAPLLAFGTSLALLIVFSGWGSEVSGKFAFWTEWTAVHVKGVSPTRVLMIAGVVLIQFATGNQLVRHVLASIGAVRPAGQPQPSDRLKGGRLLGPMERLLILTLGVGGQTAAASAVVAAKGIIRFPELNAQKSTGDAQNGIGIDEVTEYFLVGSFASWLLALGSMGLVLAT